MARTTHGKDVRKRLARFFKVLGPGLVTGASDDDPGGITTYSVAGASLGYTMLWTALATLPLVIAVQLICARIGLVTGRGLAAAVRRDFPGPLLYGACILLLVANVFNISADLAGMADVLEMLTRVPSPVGVLLFGIAIIVITVWTSYATFAAYLKWLTLVLFAYIVAGCLAQPDWTSALLSTAVPRMRLDGTSIGTFVAILGTTISPYLFFWQASQEVEEQRARDTGSTRRRAEATARELSDARLDVTTGMFLSNLVMYFIILTTAATLHRAGAHEIESSREAAMALKPLAGDAAYLLYSLGIVGTGLLAVPVLAGSASFAVAEVFGWRAGLDLRPRQARRFYLVLAAAVGGGMLFDAFGMNPIRMLFLSAVINGLLAPPLLVLVMLVGSNRTIMGGHVNPLWLNALGWTATVVMSAAAVAFVITTYLG
jgi:NRAMP (natural resistance-associated macrophage protein)-like metal ion transporter